MHFSDDLGNIPDKYKSRAKNQSWGEEKPLQPIKEEQALVQMNGKKEKKSPEEILEEPEDENFIEPESIKKVLSTEKFPDLCSERNYHIAKAQKLFPYERDIGRAFSMYRERYMTEEEKKRIPLVVSTETDPCRKRESSATIQKSPKSKEPNSAIRNYRINPF